MPPASHIDTWPIAHGLYQDRYRHVDGRWWFARRRYRSLARMGPGGVVLGLPGEARPQLRRAAIEAAARWRAFANGGATPAQARVANVVHRGFHLLAQRLG